MDNILYISTVPNVEQLPRVSNLNSDNSTSIAPAAVAASQGIHVNISEEAKDKLAQEQSKLGQVLAQQMNKMSDKDKESRVDDVDPIDEQIAQLKEKIEALKEQIKALENDDSEAALEQKKALESQLMSLNATLLTLIGKKLENAKTS